MKERVEAIFAASIEAKERFVRDSAGDVVSAVKLLAATLAAGRKLFLFGNGGSAADAQHIAAEFVNRYRRERGPLPALALTTDTSVLTSISNDIGFSNVFARQLRALGRAGDAAVAISTSGNSPNVIEALEVCRELGIRTVGLTGGAGGAMAGRVDCLLRVPADSTPRVQETHLVIGHVICELVEEVLADSATGRH
jgi:D-sedoheptulose 7-phosphate isomerase